MNLSVCILYKGALAHFTIVKVREGIFSAHLSKYRGHIVNEPPHTFTLQKRGRHWCNDSTSQDLWNDVGLAIEHT